MHLRYSPIFVFLCALALTACGSAAPNAPAVITPAPARTTTAPLEGEATPQLPVSVTDKDGMPVQITSLDRIVSMNGDITETIYALGMGAHIVGVDISATYPPDQTKAITSIGYQRRLNAEGILSLTPTLVIGDDSAGPPEVLEQVRATGVPVALTADPPTLDSPRQKIAFVAQALGVPQRGAALIAQFDADMAAARAAAARETSAKPRVLFLYLRGTDVQQVAGTGTAADAMITAAGAVNAAADAGITDFKPLSAEAVIAAKPDVLLLLDQGLESVGGVDGLLQIPGIADTPAGQQRRVVALDDLYLLGMGPRTGQALLDLAKAFHPEIAR